MQEINTYMVVGLGNPGPRYMGTRHNVGFDAAEYLAKKNNIILKPSKFNAMIGSYIKGDKKIFIVLPQTFMNLSGDAVKPIADYYKIPSKNIIVIYDDIYLDVGRLRIRSNGSAGGHNGMKSIIASLRTQDFPRLRIGVSEKPEFMDLADYVMSRFTRKEEELIDSAVINAVDAVNTLIEDGCLVAMNKYNGS